MTDKQLLDAFLQFLEDHNYCKRVYCQFCMNWDASQDSSEVYRYCCHWRVCTWANNWCDAAIERNKHDESISIG